MHNRIPPLYSSDNQVNAVTNPTSNSSYELETGLGEAVGMVLQLANGQIAACNPNAERMMGMTAAEMTGWRSTDSRWRVIREDGAIFPGEQHPAMIALRTGKPCCDVVMGFYQPNGQLVWLLLNAQPLFQGGLEQAYAVLTTLTEVPQFEQSPSVQQQLDVPNTFQMQSALNLLLAENQALRDRTERLQLALEGADLGLWDYDLAQDRLVWSDRCKSLFGLSINARVTYDRFLETIHPDQRDDIQTAIAQAIQTHSVYDLEIYLGTEDRWIHVKGNIHRDVSGKAYRMVGIAIDITDRKRVEATLLQSEERYRCLVECIPQLIWTTDANGEVNDINQRWTDYTGLTLKQAQGEGWVEIVHSEDIDELWQVWNQALQQRILYQTECRLKSVSGEYRWFLVKAIPVKDDQGQVLKWYGTSTDIEDQKQLTLERSRALELEQAARTEAEKANRIKDELLMMLSHELRTPLNPILGWCRLLRTREFDQERLLEAISTIERNAQRQRQVVEDLLDVAKLLKGGIQLRLGWVNLAETIEVTLANVQRMAESKRIAIACEIAPKVQPILGDSARLQQIVWNLLSNAIKFTAERGRITIRLSQTQTAVQLQIMDTGSGIDLAFLPHVFEVFRQSNSSTSRQYEGLGLGLTLVHHLVELHGGEVKAQSTGANQGATFTVRFPLASEVSMFGAVSQE